MKSGTEALETVKPLNIIASLSRRSSDALKRLSFSENAEAPASKRAPTRFVQHWSLWLRRPQTCTRCPSGTQLTLSLKPRLASILDGAPARGREDWAGAGPVLAASFGLPIQPKNLRNHALKKPRSYCKNPPRTSPQANQHPHYIRPRQARHSLETNPEQFGTATKSKSIGSPSPSEAGDAGDNQPDPTRRSENTVCCPQPRAKQGSQQLFKTRMRKAWR